MASKPEPLPGIEPPLIGLSYGVPGLHLVAVEKAKETKHGREGRAMCDTFCSFAYHGVVLEGDPVCERCLELAGMGIRAGVQGRSDCRESLADRTKAARVSPGCSFQTSGGLEREDASTRS